MSLNFFTIPALNPQPAQDALNDFCAAQRVVSVDRQFVAAGVDSFWAVCVTVAPGTGPLPAALKAGQRRSGGENASARVDYKQVLNEADFARYADLRAWRKAVAEHEGVPVYAVFTNEQLAQIVQRRADTLAALGEIEGVGPARLARYGAAVLARSPRTDNPLGNGDAHAA
jgi:superfamily II DNA helicase RecQ